MEKPSSTSFNSSSWSAKQGILVFAFSMGLLLSELCLTRVLSVFFYYHTAFFAVSLAMLGMGVGGVWVYLFPNTIRRGPQGWMWLTGLGIGWIPVLLGLLHFNHKHLSNLWSGPFFWIFVVVSVACLVPFLAGGVVVASWFRTYHENASALYAWDLVGAAFGALLLVPVMEALGGPTSMLCCSAAMLVVTAFDAKRGQRQGWLWAASIAAILMTGLGVYQQQTDRFAIQVDVDKPGQKKTEVLYKKWNAFSRVVLLKNQDWYRGLSNARLSYWKGRIPEHRFALLDINAFAPFIQFDGNLKKVEFLSELVSNIGYHLLPKNPKVLVIGPGGGKDILGAMLFNPSHVTGIEINPILVHDLAQGKLRKFIGNLYNHPKVKVWVGDGRGVLQSLGQKFDIIVANSVATWAAHSSGAMNLAEHSLYTAEACGLYLDRLTKKGILSVSLWDINKNAIPLRWIRTCEKAAKKRGIASLKDHVAVIANPWDEKTQFATILISRSPLTFVQRNRLASLSSLWQYAPYYIPKMPGNLANFTKYFQRSDAAVKAHKYDISAATDDRPFFLYTVRWRDVVMFWKNSLWEEDAALVNLLISLGVVIILLLLLIGGPLVWHKVRKPEVAMLPGPSLLYFLGIGLGFMLVEIPMIQRLTLWLGHPTYALTVVLTSILFYSGIGSLWTSRWSDPSATAKASSKVLALLIGLLFLLYWMLDPILSWTISWSLPSRILLSLVLLAPMGVLMGMPLPLGVMQLQRTAASSIPWAWGINGASSVVASVAALGLAALVGFQNVFLIALSFYGLALFGSLRTSKTSQSESSPSTT